LAETFYDFSMRAIRIPGLRAEVLETTLMLLDKEGTKWEIRTITHERLSLYHRGKQGPMHYQNRSAPATYGGVASLLSYVLHHEEYERQKRGVSSSMSRTKQRGSVALSNSGEKEKKKTLHVKSQKPGKKKQGESK
jgi:hypothetical protein